MVELTLTKIAEITTRSDDVILSQDGKKLAYIADGTWQVLDTINGTFTPTNIPSIKRVYDLAPNGQVIAGFTQSDNGKSELFVADNKGIRRLTIEAEFPYLPTCCFLANSRKLWFTNKDTNGKGTLDILDVDTLNVVSSIPKPRYAESLAGETDEWLYPKMCLHIPSDTLALSHSNHSRFLSIQFLHFENDHIAPAFKQHISFVEEEVRDMCFSEDGQYFVASDPFHYVWKLPTMKELWSEPIGVHEQDIFDREEEDLDAFTVIDKYLILSVESFARSVESIPKKDIEELLIVDLLTGTPLKKYQHPQLLATRTGKYYSISSNPILRGHTLVGFNEDKCTIYQLKVRQNGAS
jgi:WD40 repeat protein